MDGQNTRKKDTKETPLSHKPREGEPVRERKRREKKRGGRTKEQLLRRRRRRRRGLLTPVFSL